MNICALNSYYSSPAFKSYPSEYDFERNDDNYNEDYCVNAYGEDARNIMRNRIYERAGIIIAEYTPENAKSIEEVRINNFAPLPNNSYRGASLANRPECIELLTKTGIETVIDLEGSFTYEKYCKQNHLDYYHIDMRNKFWTNPIFRSDEELISAEKEKLSQFGLSKKEFEENLSEYKNSISKDRRKFKDKFIEISEVINNGNFYVGCELGDYRTSCFLALQSYFNPKFNGPEIKTEPYIFGYCQNMYKNLTPEDKTALGITPKYEKNLKERLNIK